MDVLLGPDPIHVEVGTFCRKPVGIQHEGVYAPFGVPLSGEGEVPASDHECVLGNGPVGMQAAALPGTASPPNSVGALGCLGPIRLRMAAPKRKQGEEKV